MEDKKSKSQVKREMTALQKLGEQLASLSEDQIRKIEIPEELREAILFAKTARKHEALRRQMQYIGTLMRDIDPEPVERAVDVMLHGHGVQHRTFKQVEEWRDELLGGNNDILEELQARFPDADHQRLRQLTLNARKESASDKPPKSSRALFRYLRELLNEEERPLE
jgi:ribosome-associated protein